MLTTSVASIKLLNPLQVAIVKHQRCQAQTIARVLFDPPASNAVDQLVARDRQEPRDRFVGQLALLVANDTERRRKRLGQQISRHVAARRSRAQKREHNDTVTAKERAERVAVPGTRSSQQLAI